MNNNKAQQQRTTTKNNNKEQQQKTMPRLWCNPKGYIAWDTIKGCFIFVPGSAGRISTPSWSIQRQTIR
jgi:hypothetical protein